ncbi:hypothetical protein PHYPSEUDO_006644 [Phytophthora pseudosyringae]|uniref:Uncharacterized protein n=1 Tax=Phytophthora pseudosyringae TaxID=221518 RepID=A0A8T1W9Z1_9STRA|nr:hypothetical protein PHYPSEUDO_006644 [Phytophthora pseudosyringae]
MACTSPNQWALASPTTSSSSRSSRMHLASGDRQDEDSDVDAHDGHETRDDITLDHVRQLIVDLLVDDDDSRRSSSFRLSDAAGLDGVAPTGGTRDAKHRSNNPEAEEEAASARERMLEENLARVLMELASEQVNLRLAANAGNALLEELSTAREEIDTLHDELDAAQVDRDRSVQETQHLRDQNAALETELQRYDAPYGAWDSSGQQNALSHMQQLQQLQRRPSLTSRSGSFSRADSCERCAAREVEAAQLEHRADELRRRCLELELARERELQRQRELAEEITELQRRNKEQHVETARTQQDLEFVTTQLEQQTQELERVHAARDTLRRTARRLEAENEDARERLAAREELVTKLANSKARAATQLQVAENRTASAQAETKRVTETLEQLQKQLENALAQQQGRRRSSAGRGNGDIAAETREQDTQDMEQLLEDATHELAALRLENRILRRQNLTEPGSDGSRARGRRRKTMCTESSAMTAADVLALGTREPKTGANSSSDSGSEIESSTTPRSQLPPLEIETIKSDAAAVTEQLLSGDGKIRRKMSLELNWVNKAATSSAASEAASPIAAPSPLGEKPKAFPVPSETELGADEVGNEQQTGVDTSRAISMLKRPSALSRLSHVNDHCVISGASKVNSPDVRLYGDEGNRPTRRSTVGNVEYARARELPIDELRREAAETPPKSPLYLGLSFIACATAATAAGLLVRR